MSGVYDTISQEILPAFELLGAPVTITRDPSVLGWKQVRLTDGSLIWRAKDGSTQVEKPVAEVYTGLAIQSSYSHYLGKDVSIQAGNMRLYIRDTPKPLAGDLVSFGTDTLTVVSAKPVAPGAVAIMYDTQLK